MLIYILSYKPSENRLQEHRRQKELSRLLLHKALRDSCGLESEKLKAAKNPHGKPYFANCPVKYNLSHTDGMVVLAISEREVGIDCQVIRPVNERLIDRVCSQAERAEIRGDADFALVWARKEALVKLKGQGLACPMAQLDSSLAEYSWVTDSHAVAAASEVREKIETLMLTERDLK